MPRGNRIAGLALVLVFAARALSAQHAHRVLLIPLDDRPSSLQFPVRIGAIGGVTVVTPPRDLLGRFTRAGRPEAIIEWVRHQPLETFDAAIISLDMLAYGGLVASRVGTSGSIGDAERRLAILREIKGRFPRLPILAASSIMRLAPTADGTNESYRVDLARWAECAAAQDSASLAETARLEVRLPASVLAAYRNTRARNAAVNMRAARLVRDRIIDRLLLTQDDARASGVHLAERERLSQFIVATGLGDRISIQTGTDEAGMLLLTRSALDRVGARPRVAPVYSSPEMRSALMPFEDEPLERVVGALIAAAGGVPVSDTTHADLVLFVHTSRLESATTARFAADIGLAAARARHGVIVADVDPKGDVQGADSAFTGALVEAGAFERLDGYASWNTASNTIGTALAQGLMHRGRAASVRSAAQQWFLLDRLFDDLLYRRVLRPEATTMVRAAGWNGAGLTRAQSDSLADRLTVRLGEEIDRLRARRPSIDATRPTCIPRDGPRLRLPWDRLFEAELTFEVPRDCGRK